MSYTRIILLLTLSLSAMPMSAQSGFDYDKSLKQMQALESKGLLQQVKAEAEQMKQAASLDRKDDAYLYALSQIISVQAETEEASDSLAVAMLQSEIASASGLRQSLLQAFLAAYYANYWQENRWRLIRSGESAEPGPDFRSWDASTLLRAAGRLYLEALSEPKALQSASSDEYALLLTEMKAPRVYRPTLYDVLAQEAVEFFQTNNYLPNPPLGSYEGFAPAAAFARQEARDSSHNEQVLRLMRDLTAFHLSRGDRYAQADLDLQRLEFVREHLPYNARREAAYLEALEALARDLKGHPAAALVLHRLAEVYHDAGESYEGKDPADPRRDYFRKAHAFCLEAEQAYPGSTGALNARALRAQIETSSLSLVLEEVQLPGAPFRALLKWKNLRQVYVRVIAYPSALEQKLEGLGYNEEKRMALLAQQKALHAWQQALPDEGDFRAHSSELRIPALAPGRYLLLVSGQKHFRLQKNKVAYVPAEVSGLLILSERGSEEGPSWQLRDRKSGAPVAGARVELWQRSQYYEQEGRQAETLQTDAQGRVRPARQYSSSLRAIAYRGQERAVSGWDWSGVSRREERPDTTHYFFTDRSIYRPGQPIYFKLISARAQGGLGQEVVAGEAVEVELRDANGQRVASFEGRTNRYGSIAGQFTAPLGGLTGRFQLRTPQGSCFVQVEEYKRPTFEVLFDEWNRAYGLNDEVEVEGKAKAYSGAPLGGATVRYRVLRVARYPYWRWWLPMPSSPEAEIAAGEARCAADGSFSFSFKALPDELVSPADKPVFTYRIYADVVDISGETRSGETSLALGYVRVEARMDIGQQVNSAEERAYPVELRSLEGGKAEARVVLRLSPLEGPAINQRRRRWEAPDRPLMREADFRRDFPRDVWGNEDDRRRWKAGPAAWERSFAPGDSALLRAADLRALPAGAWRLDIELPEEQASLSQVFILSHNSLPAAPVWLDARLSAARALPGESPELILATTEAELWVEMLISHRDQVIRREMIRLTPGERRIPVRVEESHRGGLHIGLRWARENEYGNETLSLEVPWDQKELKLAWATFRSPLLPGQQEQWKLTISGSGAEQLAAELVATLYDASLDAFQGHSFDFYRFPRYGNYISQASYGFGTEYGYERGLGDRGEFSFQPRVYQRFYWAMEILQAHSRFVVRSNQTVYSMMAEPVAAPAAAMFKAEEDASDSMRVVDTDKDGVPDLGDAAPPQAPPQVPAAPGGGIAPRRDLRETAFFMPQLETNAEGEIILSFTMPEALTRWRFLGLAHTPDLKSGYLSGEAETRKELMVVPNLPRFFREGDAITVSAKVVNLSSSSLRGSARLVLLDAASGIPLEAGFGLKQPEQALEVPAGESAALSWALRVPEGLEAVTVQVFASAADFSDGEEHILPVLPNRMLITETLPFFVRGNEKRSLTLANLQNAQSPTLRHERLTLEVTENPAWYALQSLPYLMEFPHECTEQIFSRLYANALARHVAVSNPRIEAVFRQWQASPDSSAFASQLEKNPQLRNALLEETPWVMQAKEERGRRQRLGILFDSQRLDAELAAASRQLIERQSSNGSFPWFPGLPSSPYITTHLMSGFGELRRLGALGADAQLDTLIQKGVRWLDSEYQRHYEEERRRNPKAEERGLYASDIQHLYMRSLYTGLSLNPSHRSAYDWAMKQARAGWVEQSAYMRGMLALVFFRAGERSLALEVLQALEESAVRDPEKGMYWKTPAGYYWHQAPIEAQALLIQAFAEVGASPAAVDDLRVWLLRQKRSQDWGSTRATAAACYSLLKTGPDWLEDKSPVELRLGGERVDRGVSQQPAEAGLGYYTRTWEGSEVSPEMARLQVRQKAASPAWGALYWQYFEQMDKIPAAASPLKVQRSLFVEEITPAGPRLTPLGARTLHPGDKVVVRLELRAEEAMEYVHLKDQRAAGLEPLDVLSGHRYENGLYYYQSTRDVATHFFFEYLPKGVWNFEYALRVFQAGDFSGGIATAQCMYAPEFSSHTAGERVKISE